MKAAWCDRTLVETPWEFCLCVTVKQYERELRRLNIPKELWSPFTNNNNASRATVHSFTRDSDSSRVALVCIHPSRKSTLMQTYAVLAHEATHIWQWTRESLGEEKPSTEFEAYAIQALCQRLFYAYETLTKKKKKKK